MLIDFCHHCVRSKIKADKVSFDGYEADNLLSSNINKKQKGFLSDNFVKPPINVTVQFPCNVAINRIVIDPAVGQQKSCDIKIFTASEKMTDSWLYSKDGNHGNRDIKQDGVLFSYAGNVSQTDPKTICFVNYQFKERGTWCVENLQELESFPCRVQLNCRKPGGLSNASHVTISITKTKDGKSAAIKRLEIWGIPSMKVPYPVQIMLKACYTNGLKQHIMHETPVQKEVTKNVEEKSTKINDGVLVDGVDVPEDFVDPITYEIMTVPILLPCGKNIDQLTLDRYVNTEAAWGRSPNDPFTGVPFSTGAGPVTNTSLKARIDQFVLIHSQTLRVPQTLGHSASRVYKQQNSTMTTSRLISLTSHGTGVSGTGVPCIHDDADKTSVECQKIDEDCVIISSNLKRNRPVDFSASNQYTGNNKKFKSDLKYSDDLLIESATNFLNSDDQLDGKSIVLNSELQNINSDHKTNLTRSLDTALFSALGGLPSFSKNAKKSDKQQNTETVCCKCKTSLAMSGQSKYRVPCGHCVCRSCLTTDDHFKCGICLSSWKSSDAVRVF